MKFKIFLGVLIVLFGLNYVNADIIPASYYSKINSNNGIYETTLFVFVPDTYCANNPSVWSASEQTSEIQATCYTTVNSLSYWKVVLKYQSPITTDSITLYYNQGSVSDSFTFNPRQFYKYDSIKRVQFPDGESVFIGEPSIIRSIETLDNGVSFQTILLQTVNFDNTSQYTLEVYQGTTKVGSFTGKFFKIENIDLFVFMNTNTISDDVYTIKILKNDTQVGEFIAYIGNYNINLYDAGLYIYKKAIIKSDTMYIRVRNSNIFPITISGVKVKIITNNLQALLEANTSVDYVLNPSDEVEIPVTSISSTQLDELTNSFNIMTIEVYYTINGVEKYKKITTRITRKDISYSTNVYGYVQLGQVNLIYPRPLSTITTDDFDIGTTSLQDVPLMFLFVESYYGRTLYVDSISINLHPVHGGTATVTSVDRVETIYTSSGEPVGVYRAKINYSNIGTGLIPVVGKVTINAHYYIGFGRIFRIPIYVTITSPIEFTLNTKNIQKASTFINSLSSPIYTQLNTLKYKFKTYDYFWMAYSKDADAGYTGMFFDYYDTAGDSFPVTDIAQNPKVLVTYTEDTVNIIFDNTLKNYFNYDDLFAVIMNEKGVLKEPLTYTITDTTIGDSTASEVTITLNSLPFVASAYDYYFMQAYQTNGFLVLKHQVYKTIVPFTMFRTFSVYFDTNGLTILNKGSSNLVYYPDATNTSNYYVISSNSYMTNLPIGAQPLIVYNGNYYYINPNYDFKPRLLNENIYLPLRININPQILSDYIVSDIETKGLYDLALLQLFPTQYKDFLLKADTFYTYSITGTPITSISYESNTVNVNILKEYYFYSYKIQEYKLSNQLYNSNINLSSDGVQNTQTTINYADSTSRTIHLLLPDILMRDFITNLEKTPTLFNSPIKSVISYYDPRLSSNEYEFTMFIENSLVDPQMELRSPNHVTLYYSGQLTGVTEIGINGNKLILVLP